jgi:hypothetical protein
VHGAMVADGFIGVGNSLSRAPMPIPEAWRVHEDLY